MPRRRPAALRGDAPAAGVAERRGGADVLLGGPGEPARAAVRRGLVRRARQVEACGSLLRHAAVRPAAGRASAPADHHDAAADAAAEAADRPIRRGRRAAHAHRTTMPRTWRPVSSTPCAARYGGTRLGRQELDGEIIEDREDALWSRAMIEEARVPRRPPELCRIVVAVDPPASSRTSLGRLRHRRGRARPPTAHAVVLADATVAGAKPAEWASAAVAAVPSARGRLPRGRGQPGRRHGGGGDPHGRSGGAGEGGARHAAASGCAPSRWRRSTSRGGCGMPGGFRSSRTRCATSAPNGLSGGRSPDRVDALVWAIGELMPRAMGEPRIRVAQ